ncbi:hypothetical protein [Chelatococcus asaccharovorans]|uniref:hypothetical protein n=1 Tax=Chelatococcus asaccharovorans TaxID=28210 RepID=UPI001474873D|nr:hypothetical protein [Chelatococcus asaccharovorans]MBS7707083.1 hypothetical protein [Chelatococcus asaccharovorans]
MSGIGVTVQADRSRAPPPHSARPASPPQEGVPPTAAGTDFVATRRVTTHSAAQP